MIPLGSNTGSDMRVAISGSVCVGGCECVCVGCVCVCTCVCVTIAIIYFLS